jgi:phospholipid/cholesterol/gamma-HCH transport system permease protein
MSRANNQVRPKNLLPGKPGKEKSQALQTKAPDEIRQRSLPRPIFFLNGDHMARHPETKIETAARGEAVVHLRGRLDRVQAGAIWREVVGHLEASKPPRLILDLQGITGIDTAGVALLLYLENLCASQGIPLVLLNLPDAVAPFLRYMKEHSSGRQVQKLRPRGDPISRLGEWGSQHLHDTQAFVRFLGDFLVAGPRQLLNLRRLHVGEILNQVQLAGVGAVPLLVTLSLLLGALMVFQGMTTVRNFGSIIYIADMVVVAVTREMGPLLTAIILAGRSGAAFAAELGTMKLNEEIDALSALNFDIIRFLVLPRVFALMLAGPLLTMLSDASGIIGGLLTSRVVLDLPLISFLDEAQKVLRPSDIYTGLIKGWTFGGFVGLIGCFRGLTAEQGPGSVGIQTTSAVVTSIFVVVFLDTLFSYIFQMYGW